MDLKILAGLGSGGLGGLLCGGYSVCYLYKSNSHETSPDPVYGKALNLFISCREVIRDERFIALPS